MKYLLVLLISFSVSAKEYKFSPSLLFGMNKDEESLKFITNDLPEPGIINFDINVNKGGIFLKNIPITIVAENNGQSVSACFSPEVIKKIFSHKVELKFLEQEKCYLIPENSQDIKSEFDLSSNKLNLSVAQAYLITQGKELYFSSMGYGENAMFTNYNYDVRRSSLNYNRDEAYFNFNGGINISNIKLRSSAYINYFNSDYNIVKGKTYAFGDIDRLKGHYYLGQVSTDSAYFSPVWLKGMGVVHDDAMSGGYNIYKPTIYGIARTNAIITIKQKEAIVDRISVPPGAYEINDYAANTYAGDLTVIKEEADGTISTIVLPFNSIARILAKGQHTYSFYAGESDGYLKKIPVFQGGFGYGVSDYVTLYSGIQIAEDYTAEMLGAGVNTVIGAFYFGGTSAGYGSSNSLMKNYSLTAEYSKRFGYSGTELRLAGYKYNSRDFKTLSDVLIDVNQNSERLKTEYSAYLSQPFDYDIYANLFFSRRNYWNGKQVDNYTFGVNKVFYPVTVSAYLGSSQINNEREDRQFLLSFSMPFYINKARGSSTFSYNESNGKPGYNVNNFVRVDNSTNLNLMMSTGEANNDVTSGTASLNKLWRYGDVRLQVSKYSNGNSFYSVSGSGSALLTKDALVFGREIGETAVLVDSDVGNVTLTNDPNAYINGRGKGIFPYATPYVTNEVSVETKNLPLGVEFDTTSLAFIPRYGSITRLSFKSSNKAPIVLMPSQHSILAEYGKEIFSQGQSVGYIGQNGIGIINSEDAKGVIMFEGNKGTHCQFDMAEINTNSSQRTIFYICK